MRTLVLCLAAFASSGCLLSRSLVLPEGTQVLDVSPPAASWAVSEIYVRSSAAQTGNWGEPKRQYQELRSQLETRLRTTLEAQSLLGHQAEGAAYDVEVVVDVSESSGVSPWFGLGLGLESSVLLGGAAVGSVLGGPPGSLLGLLVATPAAVVAALLPPVTSELGEFEATVTIRRRVDGAAVASRHARAEWEAELNGLQRSEQLATASGAVVPQLEKALLEALYSALQSLPVS